MIVILSEEKDIMTDKVIDWIKYYKRSFVRINDSDRVKIQKFSLQNNQLDFTLTVGAKTVKSSDIDSYWYRRGALFLDHISIKTAFKNSQHDQIMHGLSSEIKSLTDLIYHFLESKKSIGKYSENSLSKLSILQSASQVGLLIPKTYIIESKSDLINLMSKGKWITKSMSQISILLKSDQEEMFGFTEVLKREDLARIPENFGLSLIQEYIDKKYELRIFYLHGTTYCTAIFSQNDKRTAVDFRNYNLIKPNRTPPFRIPKQLNKKIDLLMKSLNMNCGSLDILYSRDDKFYFLEINPVGQFFQVNQPCNFRIEKHIAKFLCEEKI